MSTEQVAGIIQRDDAVVLNGFTPAGPPKTLPSAIAQHARERHRNGQPFQIRLLAGASIGVTADDVSSAADTVSWRAPYQASTGLCKRINQGQVRFVDLRLSEVVQIVNHGPSDEIDVAVIEASAIVPDGRIWLSSGTGNALTWLLRVKEVIIELNHYHNPRMTEFVGIVIPGAPPRRDGVLIPHTVDRVGSQCVQIDSKKVVTVVNTELPDAGNTAGRTNPVNRQIANSIVTLLLAETAYRHIPTEFLPLRSGVGNISSTIMTRLDGNLDIPSFMMYPEVLQESMVHLLETGKITGASVSGLTTSTSSLQRIYDSMDFFVSRIVLRPQEISNDLKVIRRLGVIAPDVGLEFDIYGHASSTHVAGVNLMNDIGGSGDFECNAHLSISMVPPTAKGGKISIIVPMCSHVDHSEHNVRVIVTEQGIASLRGLSPMQWAYMITDNCAHPLYRDYLCRYPEETSGGHIHHDLGHAFDPRRNPLETGSMLG